MAIESDADYGATLDDIRTVVGGVDAVRSDVVTYTDQRIRDVGALREGENNAAGGLDVLTGVDRPLAVRVYGQDQAVLNDEAEKVRGIVSQVRRGRGSAIVRAPLQPSLEINVDLAKARQYGDQAGRRAARRGRRCCRASRSAASSRSRRCSTSSCRAPRPSDVTPMPCATS